MLLIACLFQFHEQDSIYSPLPIQPKWFGQGCVLITVWTEVKHHLVYTHFMYNSHTREHTPTLLHSLHARDHSLQYCMHRITVHSIACTGSQFTVLHARDHSLQYCMHGITVCSTACTGSQYYSHTLLQMKSVSVGSSSPMYSTIFLLIHGPIRFSIRVWW